MGLSGQESDAAFFTLMHNFVTAAQRGDAATLHDGLLDDRRGEPRRPFRVTQWIAPGYCWEVPPASAWIEVHCHDLAQRGFSFFLDQAPSFDRLVVKFRPAEPIYVAARVNHARPVVVDDQGNVVDCFLLPAGQPSGRRPEQKFLVGCEFLRRFNQ